MERERTFAVHPGFAVVARTPLLATTTGDRPSSLPGSFVEAVRFASRSLASFTEQDLGADERLATTVRAYEVRARTRPTPRGAFAGAQVVGTTAGPARLRLGSSHRARSVPSFSWISEVADQLLDDPEVLGRLRFSANDLVARRGDRLEHEHATGANKPERVTLRATPAVELIAETCRNPVSLGDIVTAVQARWPTAPAESITTTVLTLARAGMLLTDLLPTDPAQDPLGHLLSVVPREHELRTTLADLREALESADKYPPGTPERLASLAEARALCDAVGPHENPIVVDVALDADLQMPRLLLEEAAEAASLLWSLSPPFATLSGFHSTFLERYGIGRRVPLLSVVDPVAGIGTPDGDTSAPAEDLVHGRVLASLIADAAASASVEVALDKATIEALRAPSAAPPTTAEIYVRVVANSHNDLTEGRFTLAAYLGGSTDAGSTTGRFASLLDLPAPAPGDDQAMTAEIVVRPRLAALATVAPPTGFAPLRIAVGIAPEPGDLTLEDLELATDGNCLTLWSRSLDRRITPRLFSRIGPAYVPPAVQLLRDLANAGTRPWQAWSWEPLAHAPFHPRVRWRRTILAPARWRLPHVLVTAAREAATWEVELDRWRSVTVPCPPQVVVARDSDQRLPLDLDDKRDRDLLRRYVRRGTDAVTETPGGPGAADGVVAGPDGGHVLELVVPLAARTRAIVTPAERPTNWCEPVVHLPGSEWLSLVLPSPAEHHDDLLAHVGDLARSVRGQVDRWFWLRYATEAHGPHLRVRFAGDSAVLNGTVLPAVAERYAQWMRHGLVGGLVVEPYEPEVDRYGGAGAIEAAERLFEADSELVLMLLADRPDDDARVRLAAMSAVCLARGLTDNTPAAIGRPRLDRPARRRVNELRATTANPADLPSDQVRQAWEQRSSALACYRDAAPEGRRADCASSVIHMHANRLGLGHDDERIARALAVQLAARGTR